jgi:hypothetical protein
MELIISPHKLVSANVGDPGQPTHLTVRASTRAFFENMFFGRRSVVSTMGSRSITPARYHQNQHQNVSENMF